MPKIKNPLFSFEAVRALGKYLTFRRRGRQTILEKTPIPQDAKSLPQLEWRHMYQKAVALWHALSADEKNEWESQARPKHMTGFAWFMSQCLRPNPGIYLPLQGGTMQGDIDMAKHRLLKLPEPVDDQEAARKMDLVGAEVGGLYGINVETLDDDKTLTPNTDKIYQYLDEGGAHRAITLATATATAGDRFVIRHNGDYNDSHWLVIYQGAVGLDLLYAGKVAEFIFNGTDWIAGRAGTGESDNKKKNLAIGPLAQGWNIGLAIGYNTQGYSGGVAVGYAARGYTSGVGIGNVAYGYTYGVAVGNSSYGLNHGVGIGYSSDGRDYGIAIGDHAKNNSKKYSIALGHYSECERVAETSVNINGSDTDQENNVVQGRWERETLNATPLEIFCGGDWAGTKRFTIRANSVLAFEMIIVARDNVANEVARYSVHDGLIKRDGGVTSMVNCTVIVDHEDDATWDCQVTADGVNNALIITVTGDGANKVQWAAVMNGVETHF